jgi:hypothetical protein
MHRLLVGARLSFVQTRTGYEEASMNRQRNMEERSRPHAGQDARERLLARTLETDSRGDYPMSATRARFRAAIVAIAPAVLLAAFVYHPYIADLTDKAAVAAALASSTTHWGFAHLMVGVGSALVVLAFLAIQSWLREAGEERWSMMALPFIVVGSTLFAFLPAMEIAMLGVAAAGADVAAVLVAMDPWFFPILITGAIIFALGILGFATGLVRSRVLGTRLIWLVVGALVVLAAARFVPLGAALYVGGAAGIVALWPLAYEMWKHPETARLAGEPRSMPAT